MKKTIDEIGAKTGGKWREGGNSVIEGELGVGLRDSQLDTGPETTAQGVRPRPGGGTS